MNNVVDAEVKRMLRVRYVLLFHQEQGKCLIECASADSAEALCDKYARDTNTVSTTTLLPEWVTDQHRRHARRYNNEEV